MIQSFANSGTEDIFNGSNTKAARRICPRKLWNVAGKRLEHLHFADELNDLRIPPGNRLEALKDDRQGQHSIRINDQYRICFIWNDAGPKNVEIVDYH